MSSELIIERDGPIARVTLNRPASLNSLTASLMDELRATWRELGADPRLRCVVVAGAGRGFCSGADTQLLAGDRADAHEAVSDELAFLPGDAVSVPVVAAVHGACAGAGLHFVADADIAIAARSAFFVDPHVSVGQVSALEATLLALRMRTDTLRRMVMLGSAERLGAQAALEAGLISEVVDDERLTARADELATAICDGSPAALAASRRVLRELDAQILGDALQRGWEQIRAHREHPDAVEGPMARIEKRPPRWVQVNQ